MGMKMKKILKKKDLAYSPTSALPPTGNGFTSDVDVFERVDYTELVRSDERINATKHKAESSGSDGKRGFGKRNDNEPTI